MAREGDRIAELVRTIVATVPGGCTWLLPVTTADGTIIDFTIAATGTAADDLYGRGTDRVNHRLTELYPSVVGGPLWHSYLRVLSTGEPERLPGFTYRDVDARIAANARFDVTIHPLLDGLLVSWLRVDESERRLARTEALGRLGWTEYDLLAGESEWSPGMYRLFDRDPALGPLSRAEQTAAMLAEDRGIAETAWQTLDSGNTSDVTVRFHVGETIRHLRILSELARDAAGRPLKIYAVVQDVSARENTRTAIETLRDQLRNREMSALAEHRLAGQLQEMIQPVRSDPFELPGLIALVSYTPAERAVRVGGDWYHGQRLPDGRVVLAVGDVAGHGLDAASGMAHLRFALVAWLSIGVSDPGALLAHMNQLCIQLQLTGTALIGLYDPNDRTLTWARAGHMPPLLARDGNCAELPQPPGLLLGAVRAAAFPNVTATLAPADVLLLYTDGLVERRGADQEDRQAAVSAELAATSLAPVGAVVPGLRRLLRQPNPDDDSCTLLVRVTRPQPPAVSAARQSRSGAGPSTPDPARR